MLHGEKKKAYYRTSLLKVIVIFVNILIPPTTIITTYFPIVVGFFFNNWALTRKKLIVTDEKKPSEYLDSIFNQLRELATAQFTETFELHVTMYIDPKFANQQLRGNIELPHGTGKKCIVGFYSLAESPDQKTNADLVGQEDLINGIMDDSIVLDVLLTTPEMLPNLVPFARALNKKKIMPSAKSGTVTNLIKEAVVAFKKGKITYKTDRTGVLHLGFGNTGFKNDELAENFLALYHSIEKNRPSGVKGRYIKKIHICTTMGPAILIDMSLFENKKAKN